MPAIADNLRERILWIVCVFLITGLRLVPARANDFEFFEKKIRPLLVEHCYKCHSAEAEKVKGGLYLDTKAGMLKGGESGKPAIVAGKAESSPLVEAIRYQNPDLQMPPPKQGKLKDEQIADLITWINSGAPDPRTVPATANSSTQDKYQEARNHWAFQPLRASKTGEVDAFIIEKLTANGLEPAPSADKRTLIRRATFDLTGLPPQPEDVDTFLKDDSVDAFSKVLNRLLDSPQYGERWGRHWLDVARFADTKGYVYDREEKRLIQSAAYRDWVIRAFNDDMPFDRFLKLQLAADQMEGTELDALAAMGYLTLGRRFLGVIHDIIDDRIDVVMRGMQGLTVSCARCHDHKFDPIPAKDYYSLYGMFAGCYERKVQLNPGAKPAKQYLDFEAELRKREAKFQATFESKRAEQSRRIRAKTTEYLVAVLDVDKLPSEEFYAFVQGDDINPVVVRSWHTYLLASTEQFHPIWSPWRSYSALPKEEFATRAKDVISSFANSKLNPVVAEAFSKNLPTSMKEVAETYGKLLMAMDKKWNDASDKKTALKKDESELRDFLYAPDSPASVPVGAVVDMQWYFDEPTRVELGRLQAAVEQLIWDSPGAPPHAVILEDRPAQKNPRVFKRGNPANKGEEIPRQFLEILSGAQRKPFGKGSGRLEFAEAIASKDNPLTARVFVNRMWLHHFGAGLVRTPSDFGTRAEPPTHPELLDWLARTFIDNGWSVKKLHRIIMLSKTYQQSSDLPSGSKALQVDPENKLISRFSRQRLDFESLRDSILFASGQLDSRMGGRAEEFFKQPSNNRRSVYGYIDRQFLPNPLRIFDFANPDLHNPQRAETISPQQALFFLNGDFVVEQARAAASRTSELASESRIKRLYRRFYQREPTAKQLASGLKFIEGAAVRADQEEPAQIRSTTWQYGIAALDVASRQIKNFEKLPHYTGDSWQGGKAWPDGKYGWARLTASGGHTGNDLDHVIVRRWVSPVDGTISVQNKIKHSHVAGHGIRGYVILNSTNCLGDWTVHNQVVQADFESVEVSQGATLDFVASIHKSLNSNDFGWSPVISIQKLMSAKENVGDTKAWNAGKEFAGPPGEPRKPLSPWEKYAQVLLLSNEFAYYD